MNLQEISQEIEKIIQDAHQCEDAHDLFDLLTINLADVKIKLDNIIQVKNGEKENTVL